jgi:beta-lactamase regulating signal transducer with metallopeptidase domain
MPTLLEIIVSNTLAATLLAALAFAASRLRQPALAHGLWLLVLIKLVTPPLIPVNIDTRDWDSRPEPIVPKEDKAERIPLESLTTEQIALLLRLNEEVTKSESLAAPAPAKSVEPVGPEDWHRGLRPIWIGGSLLWLGLTCYSVLRFQGLLRSSRLAPDWLQNEARHLASRLGLTRCPQVWIVPGAVSPMIWSVGGAPRLLFPSGLLNRLGTDQREALVLHELAHVRRRDHWVRLLEIAVSALYWWHPLVWLARHQLREAEEQCCDAWVVWALAGEGQPYARALLEAVAFVSRTRCPLPAAASGVGHVSHLRRRLTMIMQGNTPRSLSALGWVMVLTVGLCLLPLAARSQTAPGSEDDQEEAQVVQDDEMAQEEAEEPEVDEEAAADLIIGVMDEDEEGDAKDTVNELKKEIAHKRAELSRLEAKLNAVLGKMDAKAGKGDKEKAAKEKIKRKEGQGIAIDLDMKKLDIDMKKMAADIERSIKDNPELKKLTDIDMKKMAEQIQKTIKDNPDFKKLEELKKLGKFEDFKKLEELKKLGDVRLEFKGLDELKKQLGELKGLDVKNLDELKKLKAMDAEHAKALKGVAEKMAKEKTKRADDMDARLDKLLKEIEQMRKEIHESKEKRSN